MFDTIIKTHKSKTSIWEKLDIILQLIAVLIYLIGENFLCLIQYTIENGVPIIHQLLNWTLDQIVHQNSENQIFITQLNNPNIEPLNNKNDVIESSSMNFPILSDERIQALLDSKQSLKCLIQAGTRTEIIPTYILQELNQIVTSDHITGQSFKLKKLKSQLQKVRKLDLVIQLAEYFLSKQLHKY